MHKFFFNFSVSFLNKSKLRNHTLGDQPVSICAEVEDLEIKKFKFLVKKPPTIYAFSFEIVSGKISKCHPCRDNSLKIHDKIHQIIHGKR